jgi:hypothetical protein
MRRVSDSPLPAGDLSARVDIGIARALNMQIRRLADMLPGGLEHVYGFSCECGCGETFQRSAAEFDHQGGAWLDGHKDGQTTRLAQPTL